LGIGVGIEDQAITEAGAIGVYLGAGIVIVTGIVRVLAWVIRIVVADVREDWMKFVTIKTANQVDLQALHRAREWFVSQRTGMVNQIRTFLLECGVAVRQGRLFLRAELPRS
jgi:hypothetical protein